MTKFRIEITKGEEIRYISHLDYASLMERAIRRAQLPAAYSEGFNPHMKIAFASALAVGVTSDAEYMDVELTKSICQPEFFDRLTAVLPPGVRLLQAREFSGKTKALMAAAEMADYEVRVKLQGEFAEAETALREYNAAATAEYMRTMQRKTKVIEVKQYMAEAVTAEQQGMDLCLRMKIKITPTGSIKPGEILRVLKEQYALAVDPAAAQINRRGLFGAGKALIDLV